MLTNQEIAEKYTDHCVQLIEHFIENDDKIRNICRSHIVIGIRRAIREATTQQAERIEILELLHSTNISCIKSLRGQEERMTSDMQQGDAVMVKANATFDRMEKYEKYLYRLLTRAVILLDHGKSGVLEFIKDIDALTNPTPEDPEPRSAPTENRPESEGGGEG